MAVATSWIITSEATQALLGFTFPGKQVKHRSRERYCDFTPSHLDQAEGTPTVSILGFNVLHWASSNSSARPLDGKAPPAWAPTGTGGPGPATWGAAQARGARFGRWDHSSRQALTAPTRRLARVVAHSRHRGPTSSAPVQRPGAEGACARRDRAPSARGRRPARGRGRASAHAPTDT